MLHGLKPAIRMMVLAQKPDGVDALVRAPRVAEAAAPTRVDNLSSLVVKLMETQAQDKQTAEFKARNKRIAAIASVQQDEVTINAVDTASNDRLVRHDGPPRRQYRPTA